MDNHPHEELLALYIRIHRLPPLGYLARPDAYRFDPDPLLFSILQRMWRTVLDGTPILEVVRLLDEWGARTPARDGNGGKPLVRSTIYRILNDPFYAGFILWKGVRVRGHHEPMVTEEEFERVQALLEERRRRPVSKKIED